MSAHCFPVRVYYEDTDFSGNVYHAAYLKFMERARTEFLRENGVYHSELIRDGIAFAVRRMELDFAGAAHIDDELLVETAVEEVGGARLILRQVVSLGSDPLVTATVTIVAIRDGRAARLPRAIMKRFGTRPPAAESVS